MARKRLKPWPKRTARKFNPPPPGARSGSLIVINPGPDRMRTYGNYLSSKHWKELRAEVLKRWDGLCENCGTRAAKEVHHKTYERLGRELLTDLTPLCSECHRAEHPRDVASRQKERPAVNGPARLGAPQHRQATPLAD